MNGAKEIAALQRMTADQLNRVYAELFGETNTASGSSDELPGDSRLLPRTICPDGHAVGQRNWQAMPTFE